MRNMQINETYRVKPVHQSYKFYWTINFYGFFPVVHDYWTGIFVSEIAFRKCQKLRYIETK